jgi:hypothetical protein
MMQMVTPTTVAVAMVLTLLLIEVAVASLSVGLISLARDLPRSPFVQQLLILNTIFFWLHPSDLDE